MERHYAEENYERFPQGNMQTFGGHYYYDANHNPVSSSTHAQNEQQLYQAQTQMNQMPTSPYQMYAKPPQPEGWAGQMNEEYFQEESSKKPNAIMQHFYDENGQMDIQKMLSTVNQLANTVQQVTPVFQQIGSLVRLIR